jgi:alpha,alpha-trehalose phosphorylase
LNTGIVYTITARPGKAFRITKYISYHTSRSEPVSELIDRTVRTLRRACQSGWQYLCDSQRRYVDDFWRRSDIQIRGDLRVQQSLRWNLFQLLQASARVEGAGIGARELTGQTYEGHYFWDTEIYVLPFLIYTAPRIAGALGRSTRRGPYSPGVPSTARRPPPTMPPAPLSITLMPISCTPSANTSK